MSLTFWFSPGGRARMAELDSNLDVAYGAQEVALSNKTNPLDEAIYIILSFQTNLDRFKETWQHLRSAFRQWEDVECATVDQIDRVLKVGGLHQQKARIIKRLFVAVRQTFGELSLNALRTMSDTEAERTLDNLPGLSWKGARCVLLYSLNRSVFPIDGNTFRIFQRAGVIPRSSIYRRRSLHDGLQAAVPLERRRSFHVNLVTHGQHVCLPLTPKCSHCPIHECCPQIRI